MRILVNDIAASKSGALTILNVIEDGSSGWWCESNDEKEFVKCVELACQTNTLELGIRGREYLESHYTVDISYSLIIDRLGYK